MVYSSLSFDNRFPKTMQGQDCFRGGYWGLIRSDRAHEDNPCSLLNIGILREIKIREVILSIRNIVRTYYPGVSTYSFGFRQS